MTAATVGDAAVVARWSVGGAFLEMLAMRDFDGWPRCLAKDVRMRALLPPGPAVYHGGDGVADALRQWFGTVQDFELIDATVSEVAGRLHLAWRLRVRPAPFGIGDGWHVIEQQVYADAGEAITTIDLLCSGFHPERKVI